jgi:hypothetical protein
MAVDRIACPRPVVLKFLVSRLEDDKIPGILTARQRLSEIGDNWAWA